MKAFLSEANKVLHIDAGSEAFLLVMRHPLSHRYGVLEVSVCGFMCRFHGSKAQTAAQLPDSQSVVSGM